MYNASWLVGVMVAAFTGVTLGTLVAPRLAKCLGECSNASASCTDSSSSAHGCFFRRRTRLPKRLILVRHGESEGNLDPLLYGRIPDNAMHLTRRGVLQAIECGKSIRELVQQESVRFIVSPYVRTIETFRGICMAWGPQAYLLPWSEEPRVREQDFGNFQDPLKIRECKLQRRNFGSFFYRFPSGESPADVYDRISSFLESLYRMFQKRSEQNYVIVTHGISIRVLLTRYFKFRICEFEQLENFHNGEFVVLENDGDDNFMLKEIVWNQLIWTREEDSEDEQDETDKQPAFRVETHRATSLRVKDSVVAATPGAWGNNKTNNHHWALPTRDLLCDPADGLHCSSSASSFQAISASPSMENLHSCHAR